MDTSQSQKSLLVNANDTDTSSSQHLKKTKSKKKHHNQSVEEAPLKPPEQPILNEEEEEDTSVEKSELMARLEEMKRAIDGYKEAKQRPKSPLMMPSQS